MKTIYTTLALFFIALITNAQSATFEYGLQLIGINPSTGYYQVALTIKPSEDVANANTADMGTGVFHPTGTSFGNFINGDFNFVLTEWGVTEPTGNDTNGDPGSYVARIPSGANIFWDLNANQTYQLIVFDVISTVLPTSGSIRFVTNDNTGGTYGYLEQYLNVNLTEDSIGTSDFFQGNDPSTDSIEFETLSTVDNDFIDFAVYPNPMYNVLHISGINTELKAVEIFSITGQLVFQSYSDLRTIDVSNIQSGVYFIKLDTGLIQKTVKLVKE